MGSNDPIPWKKSEAPFRRRTGGASKGDSGYEKEEKEKQRNSRVRKEIRRSEKTAKRAGKEKVEKRAGEKNF
jgi:hypothetical protein